MSYCTKQNLIDRFTETELIQLSDRDNLGVIDDTVLNQAITDSDAEINGYLNRYTLPLVNVPANMVSMACDIARYHLYDDGMIEQVQIRYNSAIAYLVQVAKGVITLGPDVNGTVTTVTNNSVTVASTAAVFGIDNY